MSNTEVQKCGFCELTLFRTLFRKKQRKVSCQICNTWFHKKCSQLLGKYLKLIGFNKLNSLCQSYFGNYVLSSYVDGSPKTHSHRNIPITPAIKLIFITTVILLRCPLMTMTITLLLIQSTTILIKLNALNNKANYYEILHQNMPSLNKHIGSLSNDLNIMKINFPIIGLSEQKVRSNAFNNKISLPGYTFCYGETKTTHGGT